ncbi:MAG: GNAT family N-acetyltransferase, partial [Stackebrandtia sp.]
MTFTLRPADPGDAEFLAQMLTEALNWAPGRDWTRQRALSEPSTARYVEGWMRPGDLGVVACDAGTPIGAAWLREFSAAEPGYGYVADDVPELSVGVVSGRRGSGVGRALVRRLLERAGRRGVARVSLSVERANPAA